MNDAGTATMAEVLGRNHAGFDESDLVAAVDTAFRNGWLRQVRPATAALPQESRDVLTRHGGIPRATPSSQRHSAARTTSRLATVLSSALSAEQVAQRLAIDASRVRHRLIDGSLYALPTGRGHARRFPVWQFTADGVLPHLGEVLAALPQGSHPLEVAGFFVTPQDVLEVDGEPVSPCDWLASGGDAEPVLDLARSLHNGS